VCARQTCFTLAVSLLKCVITDAVLITHMTLSMSFCDPQCMCVFLRLFIQVENITISFMVNAFTFTLHILVLYCKF